MADAVSEASTVRQSARLCGSTDTLDGVACTHPVLAGTGRCAAGHVPVGPRYEGIPTASGVGPARVVAFEDVVGDLGQGDPSGNEGGGMAAAGSDEWCSRDELDVSKYGEYPVAQNRIEGALLGLAAGDCLGSLVEFKSADDIARRFPNGVREIAAGGPFGWRAGEGTDDTDLTMALVEAYADPDGFSVRKAADNFLKWKKGPHKDIGGTTASALAAYERSGDPGSGRTDERSAANGGLMRCIATGLVRRDDAQRREEAQRVSGVTHAERRCLDAATIYCDIAAKLLDGATPDEAIDWALEHSPVHDDVKEAVRRGRETTTPEEFDLRGYVLGSLSVSVWAISQKNRSLETTLVQVVGLGGDTDTNGAIAGGLLGAAYGKSAIPQRWVEKLEYAPRIQAVSARLADVRFENGPPPRSPVVERQERPAGFLRMLRRIFGRR